MNYFLLGIGTSVVGAGLLAYFSTYPAKAAVFPKLIIYFTFFLPALGAIVKGIRKGDLKKFSSENMKNAVAGWKANITSPVTIKMFLLVLATVLYVFGTKWIGFYPSTVIYFLIVLFGIYRRPVKGTLIYTAASAGFLYIFFTLIFKVRI